jgi:hypothetical protein
VTRTLLGIRSPDRSLLTQVFQNIPAIGRFKTVEASFNRRFSNRWSANAGFSFTWAREHNNTWAANTISPNQYPNSPNDTSLNDTTAWSFKATATRRRSASA